jgi:hypothetical protein
LNETSLYFKTIIRLRIKHNPLKCEIWSQNKMMGNKIDNMTFLNSLFIGYPCLVIINWRWPIDDMIIDIIFHKICSCLAHQPSDFIFKFLAILHISSVLFHLENQALGQWINCVFSLVANVSWNGKHPWSRPFPNRSISMCSVLKLKTITSEKYSPISTTSALQKAKGLMWGFFPC